ncbi:MAG: Transcriptional regulator, MarR family [Marmoricola sp.]|nr:Transcriptional regulator, MarR family [Marmoricola sp.]
MASTAAPTRTGLAATVELLEQELTLLARHQISSAAHAPDLELDRSGYQLLSRLELGALTLKQLAEAFRLDISTVNRQVATLRGKGLVERVLDPAGGVARLLQPTERGLALLHQDRSTRIAQVSSVLDTWSPDEVEDLRRVLAKFNSSIEDLEGQSWPRP